MTPGSAASRGAAATGWLRRLLAEARSRRLALVRSAVIGALTAACVGAAGGTELFRAFELRTVDMRFRLRGSRQIAAPLAVVFIGDDSVSAYGRWPWGWDYHALLIDALHRAGARLVLFDVLFAESPSPTDELLLAGMTRRSGVVHYISYFESLAPAAPGPWRPLREGAVLTEPIPALRAAAAGIGHANAVPDIDGTTRRVPLAVRRGDELYPSAAMRAAAEMLGVPWRTVRLREDGVLELRPPGAAPLLVPVDADGMTSVNYPGGLDSFPVRFSYRQVLEADSHPERAAVDLTLLKDRVVLVGVTFAGNTDLRPTPFSPTYPMLLVQGSMIDTLYRRAFLRRPAPALSLLLCVGFGALLGVLSFTLRPFASLASGALAGLGFAGAGFLAFLRGWQVDLVTPLAGGLAAYVLVKTVTYVEARRKHQGALERLKYLGHLVESAAEAIFSFDGEGRIASWNAGAARVFGWSEEEALGRHWRLLAPGDAGRAVEQALAGLAAGEEAKNLELPFTDRTGRSLPVEVSFSEIRDSRGAVVGVSAICQDLTEKKRMLEALVRSEKLAEIGRMGSGIVHEIKNPLTSIMMMSDMLLAAPGESGKTRRYADVIQKESQRILRLSQNILSFARPTKAEMRAVDVNRVLADTLSLVEYEMKKGKVDVQERLDPGLPAAWGDGEKLKQVFLNLVGNASHAMAGGGDLIVGTFRPGAARPEPPPGWATATVGSAPRGPAVAVRIEDHGSGIPAGTLPGIFEAFFSTKEEGKGTGLGLYITRNIVLEHRGSIEVASAVGEGTVFTILLPVAPEPPQGGGGEAS